MALTDSAVVVPGTGHIYIAPVATAVPSDPSAPADPWVEIGHTSRDEGLTITRSGGDSEVLGSWQNPSLRERRDPTTWAITFQLLQVDEVNFELYFGQAATLADGEFGVNASATPTEHALYIRIVDGANEVGLYIPRASIFADDDVTVDPENFLSFPVRATLLQNSTDPIMTWLADTISDPAA